MQFQRKGHNLTIKQNNFCAGFKVSKKKICDRDDNRPSTSRQVTSKSKSMVQNGIYYIPLNGVGDMDQEQDLSYKQTRTPVSKLSQRPTSAVPNIKRAFQRPNTAYKPRPKATAEVIMPSPLAFTTSPSDKLITMFFQGKISQQAITKYSDGNAYKYGEVNTKAEAVMNNFTCKTRIMSDEQIFPINNNKSTDELQHVVNDLLKQAAKRGKSNESRVVLQDTFNFLSTTTNNLNQRPQSSNTTNQVQRYNKLMNTLNNNYQKGISLQRFQIGDILGKGSYAYVRLAKDKETGNYVAIKTYEKDKLSDAQKRDNVKREINILKKCDHPHIIKLNLVVTTETAINLVMEYPGAKSMREYLKQFEKRRMSEDNARMKFRQVVSAIEYCHSINVIHRDVKLENILLDQNEDVKLIDFGFAISITERSRLTVFCGTPSYMAPEIVSKLENYGKPADIWSLGVLLYIFLNGSFPFRGVDDNELFKAIKCGYYRSSSSITLKAQRLINNMLRINQQERYTCKDILNDPWFL